MRLLLILACSLLLLRVSAGAQGTAAPPCWQTSPARSALAWFPGDSGLVHGRILAVHTGRPLPDVIVVLMPDSLAGQSSRVTVNQLRAGARMAVSDSAGAFRLAGVAPGPYALGFRALGFKPVEAALTINQGLAVIAGLAPQVRVEQECGVPAVRPPAPTRPPNRQ